MKYYFVVACYEYKERIFFINDLIESETPLTLDDMTYHFRIYDPNVKGVVVTNFKKLTKDEYRELKYRI